MWIYLPMEYLFDDDSTHQQKSLNESNEQEKKEEAENQWRIRKEIDFVFVLFRTENKKHKQIHVHSTSANGIRFFFFTPFRFLVLWLNNFKYMDTRNDLYKYAIFVLRIQNEENEHCK